jgi:hypothetical protein
MALATGFFDVAWRQILSACGFSAISEPLKKGSESRIQMTLTCHTYNYNMTPN